MGTLSQRYNEEFLNRAEERKEKLQYEKLTVGRKTAGRVDHILNLLFQTHQNYYRSGRLPFGDFAGTGADGAAGRKAGHGRPPENAL